MPEEIKLLIRKKFRRAILNFIRLYKQGQAKNLPALDALKDFQTERKLKKMNLTSMQEAGNRNNNMTTDKLRQGG